MTETNNFNDKPESSKVVISKSLVLINSIGSILARIVNVAILIWLQQYLLKRISAAEYSIYPVITSIMVFVIILQEILSGGLSRYIIEAYTKGDNKHVTEITSTMFLIHLIGAIVVLLLGWPFVTYIDKILTIEKQFLWQARIMMSLMVFSFSVRVSLTPFTVGLYVKQKYVLLNIIRICVSLIRIILLFILLFGVSTRVLWVVVATEFANLCGLFAQVIISRRLVPLLTFSLNEVNWKISRVLLSFGFWNFVGNVAWRIQNYADPIILNKLASPIDVTCFHLGNLFKRQIETTIIFMTEPILPSLTAMHATGQKTRLGNTFLRYGRYMIWFYMIIIIPLIIFRNELILLYVGNRYLLAATVILLLLSSASINKGYSMNFKLAVAIGKIKKLSIYAIITQVLNLCITLFLVGIFKMGAFGSALSTAIVAIFIAPILFIPLALRLAEVDFKKWLKITILPGYLPGIAFSIVLIIIKLIDKPDSWAKLILYSTIGCICYLIILLKFCLKDSDRNDLKNVLSKINNIFLKNRKGP